jgi:hypothetical protein
MIYNGVKNKELINMPDQNRFTLRIDTDIFNKIKSLADSNKRSVAKEIEYILEKYVDKDEE